MTSTADQHHGGSAAASTTVPEVPTGALLRSRRRAAAVGAMFFINGVCIANWLARVPSVRERLQLDDRTLGLVLLNCAIGSMVATRASSHIIRRFGSRVVNIVAGCAFCLLVASPSLATSPWTLALALLFLGLASGLMDVSMNSQAVELERQLGRSILSRLHGLFSLGGMIGATLGATAAKLHISLGLHLGCVAVAGAGAILLAGQGLQRDSPKRGVKPSKIVLSRPVLLLALLVFCSSIGEGAMADWTGVYLHENLGTDLGTAAIGYTVFATAMLVGRFAGDRIVDWLGNITTVRTGGLLVAIGLGAGLALNTLPALLVGIASVGLGLSTVVPVAFRAAVRIPGVASSAALATLAALGYSGFLMGPALIGMLSHESSLRVGLSAVAALGLPLAYFSSAVSIPAPATPETV